MKNLFEFQNIKNEIDHQRQLKRRYRDIYYISDRDRITDDKSMFSLIFASYYSSFPRILKLKQILKAVLLATSDRRLEITKQVLIL